MPKKKIAVLVRARKREAMRMAVGLSLADDEVTVFVMDDVLEPDESIEQSLEAMKLMNVVLYTNNPSNPFPFMSAEDIARALVSCDVVIPY
ncbi:MAG: hypothetical protein P8Y39_11280 [Nitrospirota bacterium]